MQKKNPQSTEKLIKKIISNTREEFFKAIFEFSVNVTLDSNMALKNSRRIFGMFIRTTRVIGNTVDWVVVISINYLCN